MKDIVRVPKFLLPETGTDMSKWSVVACDQYTSEPEYWERVRSYAGDSPSTLNIIFPEAYLGKSDDAERISSINKKMRIYMNSILEEKTGFVLVERTLAGGTARKGLLVCVDLEAYDYTPFTDRPIRATEGTVTDRLPPRMRIRENACLECPHILFLIEDKNRTVIEPLFSEAYDLPVIYDFMLMENGGRIAGRFIGDLALQAEIIGKIHALEKDGFLFAVGDGNHSLATAKELWKKIKASLPSGSAAEHPARYAMVEVVNIFDNALVFEPIHRVLFNARGFLDEFETSENDVSNDNTHCIRYVTDDSSGYTVFRNPRHNLPVGTLQEALDSYLSAVPGAKVDYIHGEDVVRKLSKEGNIGFILSSMRKEALFETVKKDGVLPRKTFSMGEAHEKRYYLECRRII